MAACLMVRHPAGALCPRGLGYSWGCLRWIGDGSACALLSSRTLETEGIPMTESRVITDQSPSLRSMHRATGSAWANSTILMGVFSALWGTIATMYMPEPWTYIVFAVIGIIALGLIGGGVSLLGPARELRAPSSEEEALISGRRRVIGLSLVAEVVLLAVGFPLLAVSDLGNLMAPYGALVVGLHFLPFGWAFDRSIDYVIGGWTIVWALVTMVMATSEQSVELAWTLVGLAASAATITYGVQMLVAVRRAVAPTR